MMNMYNRMSKAEGKSLLKKMIGLENPVFEEIINFDVLKKFLVLYQDTPVDTGIGMKTVREEYSFTFHKVENFFRDINYAKAYYDVLMIDDLKDVERYLEEMHPAEVTLGYMRKATEQICRFNSLCFSLTGKHFVNRKIDSRDINAVPVMAKLLEEFQDWPFLA